MRWTHLAALSVGMHGAAVGLAQEMAAPRAWTILLYGAADNNADGPILSFLHSIRKALDDDPAVELLALLDRSDKFSTDAAILGEDFTGTRLYRVHRKSVERLAGGAQLPELAATGDVELNTADPGLLRRFVAWGKATAPAERTMLLIYSHADGRTMCPDEGDKRDMGIPAVSAGDGPAVHVDVLALELCNMGGIEAAYQWRPGSGKFTADVLVAIPNAGPPLDWRLAFARLRSPGHATTAERPGIDPAAMSAEDFGRLVVDEGALGRAAAKKAGDRVHHESAGCYDLRAADDVKRAVDRFAAALGGSAARTMLFELHAACMNYDDRGPFVDLYDLAAKAAANEKLLPDVRSAAAELAKQVDRFVLTSFGMDAYPGFLPGKHGVFIVLPAAPDRWSRFKWYSPLPQTGDDYGRWAFLSDGATAGNGKIENWFELLDAACDEGDTNGYRW
jgi:clostripain